MPFFLQYVITSLGGDRFASKSLSILIMKEKHVGETPNGTVPGSLPYDGHSSGAWKTTSATTTTTPTTSCESPRDGRCRCDCGGGRSPTSRRGRRREGRTADAGTLPSRGSLFLAHCTCSPFLLLLLLSPLHFTQSPQSIDCYFRCFSPRHSTANASGGGGGRRPTGAADAAGGGGRGRFARSRSVGRSVIPTREDEREEESAGRTELTHRTDGRIKRRTKERGCGRRVDQGAAAVKMETTTGSPRRHITYVALPCTRWL